MQYKAIYNSPIGQLTLVSDGENLTGLSIEGERVKETEATQNSELPIFRIVSNFLDSYFAGEAPALSTLPLFPKGSPFQTEVWNILKTIPHGKVTTYGDIAKEVAKKLGKERMSAQAVGGAVGSNPIAIIIPCHRVIGVNGNLTGFAAGIDTKIKLLNIEGIDTTRFFVPKKGSAL